MILLAVKIAEILQSGLSNEELVVRREKRVENKHRGFLREKTSLWGRENWDVLGMKM